jgi:hypothetical protein
MRLNGRDGKRSWRSVLVLLEGVEHLPGFVGRGHGCGHERGVS